MANMTLAQKFVTTFGAVYVAVGILGFLPFLGGTFNQDSSNLLGIFGVTAVHNIVHILVGFVFLAGSRNDANARQVSILIGAVYTLVAVIGFMNLDFVNDLLAINLADNLLHLVSGVLALGVGFAGRTATA